MDILNGIDSNTINEYVIPWSISLVSALIVFIIGRWVAKLTASSGKFTRIEVSNSIPLQRCLTIPQKRKKSK